MMMVCCFEEVGGCVCGVGLLEKIWEFVCSGCDD